MTTKNITPERLIQAVMNLNLWGKHTADIIERGTMEDLIPRALAIAYAEGIQPNEDTDILRRVYNNIRVAPALKKPDYFAVVSDAQIQQKLDAKGVLPKPVKSVASEETTVNRATLQLILRDTITAYSENYDFSNNTVLESLEKKIKLALPKDQDLVLALQDMVNHIRGTNTMSHARGAQIRKLANENSLHADLSAPGTESKEEQGDAPGI